MSGSYAIPRIACQTSAVVIEILSVEDDDNLAYVIMTTLRLGGFSATRAKNGKEALRLALDDGKPDLIVLDVMLPTSMDSKSVSDSERRAPLSRSSSSLLPIRSATRYEVSSSGVTITWPNRSAAKSSLRASARSSVVWAKPQRINRCDAMTSRWMTNPTR